MKGILAMKKVVALVLVCMMMFALSACFGSASSVDGKTYVFHDLDIEFENEEMEEMMGALEGGLDALKEQLKPTFAEAKIIFKDGKASMVGEGEDIDYEQDGDTVKLLGDDGEEQELKVDGDKLILVQERQGMKITVIFKQK